jgi:hypothetical protein
MVMSSPRAIALVAAIAFAVLAATLAGPAGAADCNAVPSSQKKVCIAAARAAQKAANAGQTVQQKVEQAEKADCTKSPNSVEKRACELAGGTSHQVVKTENTVKSTTSTVGRKTVSVLCSSGRTQNCPRKRR